MKTGLANILKGKFLVSDGAFNHWVFIVFCALLAIIMIASSHSAERKVYQVAELNQQLRELRSEFVDTRKTVMQKKMESNVAKKMEKRSIGLSDQRPYKITIKSQ
ncbi:S-adenosyl-methyltransferase [Psychroflexus gondwanensis]|jgi:ABC-type bacteriocin/lantibiotic exporter with double-glycine peptidase domain|uniref:S-adenosyl-methyltransferase n=1 Tax=Psychroflexus gondwanensis ACAM 44 TaxID=1189619 RepID=N1WJK6_9FLAO|nr:FtsL-like putative cell division protein [Psychroflexus gondwanensis]EMY80426.1 hypothetical protein pgond44_11788 [Psychroflexus gondwanensis ACAM 44]TXE21354.1 S-adenosyl-methyltransferase [Psychroflexus gondwanensis]